MAVPIDPRLLNQLAPLGSGIAPTNPIQPRILLQNQPYGALQAGPGQLSPGQILQQNAQAQTNQIVPQLNSGTARLSTAPVNTLPGTGEPIALGPTSVGGTAGGGSMNGAALQSAFTDQLGSPLEGAGVGEGAGLLSRLWGEGAGGLGLSLKGVGSGALSGLKTGGLVGLPLSIAGQLIGHFAKGQTGQDVATGFKDAGTGAALGGTILGGVAAALPGEIAAGPPGWIGAGVGALAGGGVALYDALTDSTPSAHESFVQGWHKINHLAQQYGITDPDLIQQAKVGFNEQLKAAGDKKTDPQVRQALIGQIDSQFQNYAWQKKIAEAQTNNLSTLGNYNAMAQQSSNDANTASANAVAQAYESLASQSPNGSTAALARAGGALAQSTASNANAAAIQQAHAAPLQLGDLQNLVAQYQQQLAAKNASGTSGGSTI